MAKTPEELFFLGLGGQLEDESEPEKENDDPNLPSGEGSSEEYEAEKTASEYELENQRARAEAESQEAEEREQLIKEAQQVLSRKVTPGNLFSYPEADPYVLDLALLRTFQLDWFTWEPDTLFEEIQNEFRSSVAEVNRHKILAMMTMHVIDAFWDQWEVFEKSVLALNGIVPRLDAIQPPDIAVLMAGVDIANLVDKKEFSEEVARYTAACFLHHETTYAPPPLDFAQIYISNPKYICGQCGQEGSALPPFDGRCDSCSRRFEDHPFNFEPAPDAKDDPSQVRYELTHDPAPVKSRYEELVDKPAEKIRIDESSVDIEAARLLTATDYLNLRRQQRVRQLRELSSWLEQA